MPSPRDDEDEDDDERSAADDPTAMWDEDALRQAGMADIAGRTDTREAAGPATSYGVRGDARDKVVVGRTEAAPAPPARTPGQPGGLSWTLTIILAGVLGVAVYLIVRLLK